MGDKKFMWAAVAVVAIISVILSNFIIPHDMWRLLILFALWILFFEILSVIMGLIIVNMAQFSRPEEIVVDDDLEAE